MLKRAFSHDDRLMGMALGFYEEQHNGVRLVGHGGDTQYFHSYLGVDAANDLTFFVSFGGPGGSVVRSAFAPAFYNEYFPTGIRSPGTAGRLRRERGALCRHLRLLAQQFLEAREGAGPDERRAGRTD